MKKFCFFVMIFLCAFVLVSCSFKKKIESNISEKDEMLFSCEDENFFITLCIGKRENPYIVDGKSSELIDFAVLTAHKKQITIENDKAEFLVKVNGIEKKGSFEVNPFDGSFVVDLLNIGNNLDEINVEILVNDKAYKYQLKNTLNKQDLTSTAALKLAEKELGKIEKQLTNNGKSSFEVYVRLMQNPGQVALFYISAINENDELFAMIIDPKTKEVIAKNFK